VTICAEDTADFFDHDIEPSHSGAAGLLTIRKENGPERSTPAHCVSP